jgi:hypothetical protein
MKKTILIVLTIILFSCSGEYKKQVTQGAENWCECKAIDKQLETDPENYDLIEERARLLRYVETNKELSGDSEQFEKDIKELTKDC